MRKWQLTGAAFATAFLASAAMGQSTWVEEGDAGNLPSTAQVPEGSGALTMIEGSTRDAADSDMYLIQIDDVSSFYATTTGHATIDTQLFLFDSNGFGVTHNDDDEQTFDLQSRITGQFLTDPGEYYLAISTYDVDPLSSGGAIWEDQPFREERAPDGPGAGGEVTSWESQFGSSGAYGIELAGVSYPGGGGGFAMTVSGTCPGEMTLSTSGGTPDTFVAFIFAFGEGSAQIPNGQPCEGTELGLDATARLLTIVQADANGEASFTGNAPAGACGNVFVQALDVSSCGTSNVEPI